MNFDSEYFSDIVSGAEQFILDRIKNINKRVDSGVNYDADEVKCEMSSFITEWQTKVDLCLEANVPLFFGRRFMVNPPGTDMKRLLKPYNTIGEDNSIETLTSMRNVDTPVKGKVIIWEG